MTIELNLGNLLFIVFALVSAFWALIKLHAMRLQRDLDSSMEQTKAIEGALTKYISDQEKLHQQQQALLMERITRLEVQLEKSPSHKDFDKVYDRLNEQSREVSEMAGELRQMNANLRMVVSHLNGSNKACAA